MVVFEHPCYFHLVSVEVLTPFFFFGGPNQSSSSNYLPHDEKGIIYLRLAGLCRVVYSEIVARKRKLIRRTPRATVVAREINSATCSQFFGMLTPLRYRYVGYESWTGKTLTHYGFE